MTDDAHDAAIEKYGFDWSVKKSTDRLTEDLEKWPVDRCKVAVATETVKFDSLSRSNSKLIEAAVLIADIDGFSAYIESLEDDAEKRDAIVALDMIRAELREVLKNDYSGGVRVQYQGDNIVGLVHMPGKSDAQGGRARAGHRRRHAGLDAAHAQRDRARGQEADGHHRRRAGRHAGDAARPARTARRDGRRAGGDQGGPDLRGARWH